MLDFTTEMRWCPGCRHKVPVSEFRKSCGYCRECYRTARARRLALNYKTELEAQDGTCAICHQPPEARKRLHLDHDHETGLFRGLLCSRCNRMLGNAGDDPQLLAAAIEYLMRPGRDLPLPWVKRNRRHPSHFPQAVSLPRRSVLPGQDALF